ncbi:hypothetical protein F3Y22_tig00110328pilonHSYRG01083 [Hibiscus syriacus]|uniref:AAA+ ATPase At3g28540-like C-terminal domain-containing protein n=1 Tax=Hibiscus syriacus TaxID=106335 RepID=A0A6A3B298_HIBSY|nr:hypothetical protein F3Y22_tig00110328pilonHSYRG01083 [Hibiscus syriacus]
MTFVVSTVSARGLTDTRGAPQCSYCQKRPLESVGRRLEYVLVASVQTPIRGREQNRPAGCDTGLVNIGRSTQNRGPDRSASRQTRLVYGTRRHEDHDEPDVVTSIFSIYSISYFALLYNGSTHSYVASSVARGLEISDENTETASQFIFMWLHFGEFNLILGMDWLTTHRANLDCDMKRATLKTPDNREVVLIRKRRGFIINVVLTLKIREIDGGVSQNFTVDQDGVLCFREHQRSSGLLQLIEIPQWKWERVTMDFVSSLPLTPTKNDPIWVIVDRLTKSVHFIPVRVDYPLNKLARLYIFKIGTDLPPLPLLPANFERPILIVLSALRPTLAIFVEWPLPLWRTPLRLVLVVRVVMGNLLFGYGVFGVWAFTAIQNDLSEKSSASANRLKADSLKDGLWCLAWITMKKFLMCPMEGSKFGGHQTGMSRDRCSFRWQDNQRRKLYSNNPTKFWNGYNPKWSHVAFEHPASFDSLAMDAERKEEIKNDLNTTGKSNMISDMANHLKYDVFDLELTAIKDNTELRLLIGTTSKSILVIEDNYCSLDITWGERIIVFTTNYPEKLDQAVIRRVRMDKHIEMSYSRFEAFKVNNYLKIDSHLLFEEIGELLGRTDMTPADVAENLNPKFKEENVEMRLNRLIEALKAAKEVEGTSRPNEKRKRGSNNRKKEKHTS